MPNCSGKATIHHARACCRHRAEMGFICVCIYSGRVLFTEGFFFFLFEILYLKWKENNRLAELKMEVQLNGIFWGGANMREFLLLNMKIKQAECYSVLSTTAHTYEFYALYF